MKSTNSTISLQPYVIALNNSAWSSYKSGNKQAALSFCRQSIVANKNNPHALHLLGLLHADSKDLKAAERYLLKSLELLPMPNVWSDLATLYHSKFQLEKAEVAIKKAIALTQENNAYHYAHLANIQAKAGKIKDAVTNYRQALSLNPNWPEVYNNIGELLLGMNDLFGAETAFRTAISQNDKLEHPHQNLGITLFNVGRQEEALACFSTAANLNPSSLIVRSNKIMMMTYLPTVTEKQLYDEAIAYATYAKSLSTAYTDWPHTLSNECSLHVGFVSGRFCHSPVMHFLEGLLSVLHRSTNIKISLYSNTPKHDEATELLKSLCDSWRSINSQSDKEVAETIFNDKVDVLIDLAGHSKHNRLAVFSWKPAPIQAEWMEFGSTTGLPEIDYMICDRWSVTPSSSQYYVEKFWQLPQGRLCFANPPFDLLPNELPALSNGYITFGSFNNLAKLNSIVFETWAEILKLVPNSRLLMTTSQLDNEVAIASILNSFESLGISKERLTILPPQRRREFMMQYNLVDISLDSFPYQGVTTTVESLWMGIPVVMYAGDTFISRQSVNVHALLGLNEWICSTRKQYIDCPVSNALDTAKLTNLRNTLRSRIVESPIFDAEQFASDFITMLFEMRDRHCHNKSS